VGNTFVVVRAIITVVIGEFSVEELDHVIQAFSGGFQGGIGIGGL
jgi:hypothetical protein